MDNLVQNITTFSIAANMLPILAVWVAVIIHKLVPISASVDPIMFFRFVCQQMAHKVIKPEYSSQQCLISGSLALLMLLAPTLIIAYLLYSFASYQWLLSALLLWLAIQSNQEFAAANNTVAALAANKKQLAKDTLQPILLRNTQPLSPLGIIKASVESIFLRYHHQQFTTIICFLLFGPIGALAYRLCFEAHQAWNVKLGRFAFFGRLANFSTLIFQFIPCVLLSFSFVLLSAPQTMLDFVKQKQLYKSIGQALFAGNNQNLLLMALAYALNVNMGGPVMYDNIKRLRPRAFKHIKNLQHVKAAEQSQSPQPTFESVKCLISLVNRHLIVSLIILTWTTFWFFPS